MYDDHSLFATKKDTQAKAQIADLVGIFMSGFVVRGESRMLSSAHPSKTPIFDHRYLFSCQQNGSAKKSWNYAHFEYQQGTKERLQNGPITCAPGVALRKVAAM